MRKSLSGLIVLLLLSALPALAQETALVRVGHFAPDAPEVDVYVNGDVAVEALAFTEVTGFLELPAGDYDIAVAPAGTSAEDAVIEPVTLTFEAGLRTTVAAYGSLENDTLNATVFTEEAVALDSDTAVITLLHTIEGEGGLDLIGSGIQMMQSVRYPDANRDGAFTREIPAGRYNFDASLSADPSVVLREANGIEVEGGSYTLLVAVGPQSLQGDLLVVSDEGRTIEEDPNAAPESDETGALLDGTALVRVAHLSPDTPQVDVYVNGDVAVEALAFTEVTPFLELDSGDYEIAVAAAGTSLADAVIGPVTLTFAPDVRTTVAAVGSLEDETLTATAFTEDVVELDSNTMVATLFHAIEGEIGVDLYGSGIQLMVGVRYPGEGGDGAFTREIPAGRYNFDLTIAANADAVIREANGVEVEGGGYLLLIAVGPQSLSGDLLIVTDDGRTVEEEDSE